MGRNRVLIFKFQQRQYIDDFLRGQMCMNTLAYFANIENSPPRRDAGEGQAFLLQGDKAILQMEVDGEFKPIPGIINIAYRHPDDLKANVFCMYALHASKASAPEPINPRNLEFGDTFAVLRDAGEFLRRVQAAARKLGQELEWGLVEYVDKQTYHGPMGIFRKASDFSYQSEFRIALLPGTGSRCFLDVGDLTDIAISGPLADLNRGLMVESAAGGARTPG